MQDLFENLILFENVGLRYGERQEILKDVSFAVNKGDFFFLTGVSGAGKSSLLKLIDMSLKPTRGLINMFGTEVNLIKERQLYAFRRKIGIIFQDYKLINDISIYENIALPLKIIKEKAHNIKARVEELLNWLGLLQYKNELPLTLSGGQQQIVAIARAIITDPVLILADEPTGNIDEAMANNIMKLLLELNKKGTSVVLATHNLNLVKKSNKKVMVLQGGKLSTLAAKEWHKNAIYNLEQK